MWIKHNTYPINQLILCIISATNYFFLSSTYSNFVPPFWNMIKIQLNNYKILSKLMIIDIFFCLNGTHTWVFLWKMFIWNNHLQMVKCWSNLITGFPGGLVVKNLPTNVGDVGSVPGLRRSPGEGNGNPL